MDVPASGGTDTDNWVIDCSDEELYSDWQDLDGELVPPTEHIEKLYMEIEAGQLPQLAWRCPGRRSLPVEELDEDTTEEIKLPDMSDFDFGSDDFAQPTVTTPRRTPGSTPRGSAKKKSTSLDKILKNMQRTKELEAKEASEASAAALKVAVAKATSGAKTTTQPDSSEMKPA